MLVWTLFFLHKSLMLSIGLGGVLFALGRPNGVLSLLLSGFLITQAVFGRCIVTMLENVTRSHYGYDTTHNQFIAHNMMPNSFIQALARVAFGILGIVVLTATINFKANYGRSTSRI